MRSLDDAQSQFAYHPATPDTASRHAEVRDLFTNLLPAFWRAVPDGPEKTLAIRKLQEAQMYANLAIALTAPADTSATRKVARILPVVDDRILPVDNQADKGLAYIKQYYGDLMAKNCCGPDGCSCRPAAPGWDIGEFEQRQIDRLNGVSGLDETPKPRRDPV